MNEVVKVWRNSALEKKTEVGAVAGIAFSDRRWAKHGMKRNISNTGRICFKTDTA